ncbi:hypothetical protein [Vibrio parahaemolyticus]|uniref:hypothetical protein n=1 Tax=Vibrio parahaemolyticus TaxID=670 RepID=UPI001E4D4F14|nr:hypothetical protein [Vibrio parahaemolyticus]
MKRPNFFSYVSDMRRRAKMRFPNYDIHISHRLSWSHIATSLELQDEKIVMEMIDKITIPARDFGNPLFGGTRKGDLRVRNAVQRVIGEYGLRSRETAKALNSVPYNLRPGSATINIQIRARPDAHFFDNSSDMTPQSEELFSKCSCESSDFMTMEDFYEFEKRFDTLYVKPFLSSIERLL